MIQKKRKRRNYKKEREKRQLMGQHFAFLLLLLAYITIIYSFVAIGALFFSYIAVTTIAFLLYKIFTPDVIPYWINKWKKWDGKINY